MAKKVKTKALSKTEKAQALALFDEIENDSAGAKQLGMEEADGESFAVPYLLLLQKGSPQCDEDSDQFIKGAVAGKFLNASNGKLYDEVNVIPCHFRREYVKWGDRETGGGFLGKYKPNDPIVIASAKNRGTSGRLMIDDEEGAYLTDTRYHFVLIVLDDAPPEMAILSLSSTQIKKSKKWCTAISSVQFERKDKTLFNPPSFANSYLLTSVGESKDKYTWKGLHVGAPVRVTDVDLYKTARDFQKLVLSGDIEIADDVNSDATKEEF